MGTYTEKVQQLYVAYFNRPADSAGLQYWERIVANQNGSVAAISAEFSKSAEYLAAYADMSSAQIVNQVYLNLFGRYAEAGGLSYWSDLLDRHLITIDNVVTQVAKGAQGSDSVAYNSKVWTAMAITQGLRDYGATWGYSGPVAINMVKSILEGVRDQASRQAVINNLPATINKMATASLGPSVSTTNLTNGIDHLSTGAGDDVIASVGKTLQSADQIDGGAGNDLLYLIGQGDADFVVPPASISNVETIKIRSDRSATVDSTAWSGLETLYFNAVGGGSVNASAQTALSVLDLAGAGHLQVNGGKSVFVSALANSGGTLDIGLLAPAAGSVSVQSMVSGGQTGAAIHIQGGSSIGVLQNHAGGNTTKNGPVTIRGAANTVSVSVENLGTASLANTVNIDDFGGNGSIATINVTGYSALNVTGPALSLLKLAEGKGDINLHGIAKTSQGLALELNKVSASRLSVDTDVGPLNIRVDGTNELGSIMNDSIKTLNLSGNGALKADLTAMTALSRLNLSGTVGISGDLSKLQKLESLDVSANTAFGNYTIDGARTNFAGGTSNDYVTLPDTLISKSIALAGGSDTLKLSGSSLSATSRLDGGAGVDSLVVPLSLAVAISNNPSMVSSISNFEKLVIGNPAGEGRNQSIEMTYLSKIGEISMSGGVNVHLQNWQSAKTLTLNGDGTSYVIENPAFISGTKDVLSIALRDDFSASNGIQYATAGISAPNVEVVNISTSFLPASSPGSWNTFTLNGNSAQRISIFGSDDLALIASDTALTDLDLLGMTGNFSFVAGAVTGKLNVNLSKSPTSSGGTPIVSELDLSAANQGVFVNARSANVNIVFGSGHSTLVGGTGTVTYKTSANSLEQHGNLISSFKNMPLTLNFADSGRETVHTGQLRLASDASFADYANAAIRQGGDASVNGAFSWFQYQGDTWLVESHHNGTAANAGFIDGTDFIVRLQGQYDLGYALSTGSFDVGAKILLN